jgi:hypothetical protein
MPPSRSRRVVVGALALLALLLGACRAKETDEARIRKVLDEGAAALEARDTARAADTLAPDYRDPRGRTRDQLERMAFFVLQQGPVLVRLGEVKVEVTGAKATAAVHGLAVQGSGQLKSAADLLPTNSEALDLTVHLAKHGSEWKVTSIEGDHVPLLD